MKSILALLVALFLMPAAFAAADNPNDNYLQNRMLDILSGNSTATVTNGQAVRTVTTAGTPVRLVASSTLVDSVEIFAMKNVTTANTGNIYVGFNSTGGQNFRVLTPGSSLSMKAPPGKKLDLTLIWIDAATSADAVVYTLLN